MAIQNVNALFYHLPETEPQIHVFTDQFVTRKSKGGSYPFYQTHRKLSPVALEAAKNYDNVIKQRRRTSVEKRISSRFIRDSLQKAPQEKGTDKKAEEEFRLLALFYELRATMLLSKNDWTEDELMYVALCLAEAE